MMIWVLNKRLPLQLPLLTRIMNGSLPRAEKKNVICPIKMCLQWHTETTCYFLLFIRLFFMLHCTLIAVTRGAGNKPLLFPHIIRLRHRLQGCFATIFMCKIWYTFNTHCRYLLVFSLVVGNYRTC